MKDTYTKIFLKQANIAISDVNLKIHTKAWWQNTRAKETGGLRLTDEGFDFLKSKIDLHFYEIPLPKDIPITTESIIFLDNFITCPYYLSKNSIFVTEEKKAMELYLFSGDIRKYGITKSINRQKNLHEP